MKLYELAPAPSARRVAIFLKEKGIEIERVPVDIRGGENLRNAFSAKSANGRIPVLELDDGTTICESVAICRYIDQAFPSEHGLFGSSPLEQAQVEMWHRIVELEGLFVAFQAFRNITGIYSDRERCVETWGEEAKQRVLEFLPKLNKRLTETPYVAGDFFSVVDITAFVMVGFIANLGIEIDNSLPAIQSWYQKISNRPSVQAD